MKKKASQLTYTGLFELHQKLRDNQLCVLFRNNHFSTLFKYKNQLYSLLSDSGFLHQPTIWEKLDEVFYFFLLFFLLFLNIFLLFFIFFNFYFLLFFYFF